MLQPGQVFAGYTIVRMLGSGGMGAVYLADDPELPRRVALKVLDERLGANPRYRSLFRREADIVGRLDHPNVVSVFNRGVEGDVLWIAMQYVAGTDAGDLIRHAPTGLAPRRAARIVCGAARGLEHAHRQNMLHRDVKPSNLLVATDDEEADRVLVVDFGLARTIDADATVTETGWLDCTPAYAAPEVLAGQPVDRRADIYSLGATLLALLTGSNPTVHSPRPEYAPTRADGATGAPTRGGTSHYAGLDGVLARAMADEPADRFQSCGEFARAVSEAIAADEHAPEGSGRRRWMRARGRRRWMSALGRRRGSLVLVGAVGIAAALVAAVVALVSGGPAEHGVAGPPASTPAGGARSSGTAPKTTKHCYWSTPVLLDNDTYLELPSGADGHSDPHCLLDGGDRGRPVRAVQNALTLCHHIPLAVDGKYGAAMRGAIQHRQTEAGVDVDGLYGPQTRDRALRWPVFRTGNHTFVGRCVAAPS